MRFLLDTNVFREIGKTQPHENVAAWLATVADADLALSALTVREVAKGIARLRPHKPEVALAIERRIEGSFAAFGERVLPIDGAVARLWGEWLADSDKHIDDVGIAATARVHGLILVTRNLKHFTKRDIEAIDPYRAEARLPR